MSKEFDPKDRGSRNEGFDSAKVPTGEMSDLTRPFADSRRIAQLEAENTDLKVRLRKLEREAEAGPERGEAGEQRERVHNTERELRDHEAKHLHLKLVEALDKAEDVSEEISRMAFDESRSDYADLQKLRERAEFVTRNVELSCRFMESMIPTLEDASIGHDERLDLIIKGHLYLEQSVNYVTGLRKSYTAAVSATQVENEPPTKGRLMVRLLSNLRGLLREIAKRFWSLIKTILTPKEWVVKGEVSTIPFFVGAKGSVEIKFGK